MPRAKKLRPPLPPPTEEYPDPADLDLGFTEPPEPEATRPTKRQSRNVTNTTPARIESSSPEPFFDDTITSPDREESPPVSQRLLRHISFPTHSKSRPVDIRDEVVSTEKVSDQYTPPSDTGITEDLYSKNTSPDPAPRLLNASNSPIEPSFSARASFKSRSPPISPPQQYARPLSFTSGVPPLPAYSRQLPGQYGSPHAPHAPQAPHLPQPHFYLAQDIDLGIGQNKQTTHEDVQVFSKLTPASYFGTSQRNAMVVGYSGKLRFCSYDEGVVEDIGILAVDGILADAEPCQWWSGTDPFASLRPLVAVNTLQTETSPDGILQYKFCVSVYSLSQQKSVTDLLQVKADPVQLNLPAYMPTGLEFCNHLRMKSVGNYIVVASGRSGEVFVFSPALDPNGLPVFECLHKFWTTIQPKEQRRDSSHTHNVPAETIATGTCKIRTDESVPMMALSGRWLAICPPPSTSQHSMGAVLGQDIVASKQAGLDLMSAGSRPTVSCEVDSPDADTLLGKVARGVAQEMVKGAKWLGDQGMQAWQNYWKKDEVNPTIQAPVYTNGAFQQPQPTDHFPPTHADARQTARDPDIISIFDLKVLQDPSFRRAGPHVPQATFMPPNGCSFLSFAPNGLMLLTASRKGDFQYVWDLLETKHGRIPQGDLDDNATRNVPRVRQLARFDRMSGSVIVDVVWEKPSLMRFALLTKNKTIHLFDLPLSAMRWPPARRLKKARPISAPPTGSPIFEHGAAPVGGFFASAMSIAGKTQPMLANLRGRTPSSSGGFAGIGTAGIGIATATGARGSKAVASGLSKSLGAATETVSRLQHAGESRLHLKSEKGAFPDRMVWTTRAHKGGLCILSDGGVKFYQVKRSKPRDHKQHETTVFDARRPSTVKFPDISRLTQDEKIATGLRLFKQDHADKASTIHPLSFAEIETNAPYQPFHSDRRVGLFVVDQNLQQTAIMGRSSKKSLKAENDWVFGDDIPTIRVNTMPAQNPDHYDESGSVIYRETAIDGEHVVSTTRRRKKKINTSQYTGQGVDEEALFEDDYEVLDFASDRV